MKRTLEKLLILVFPLLVFTSGEAFSQQNQKLIRLADKRLKGWTNPVAEWSLPAEFKHDSVKIKDQDILVYFPVVLSYVPVRENTNDLFIASLRNSLGRKFRGYTVKAVTNGYSTEQLIPNIFRSTLQTDAVRKIVLPAERPVLIRRLDSWQPSLGLGNKNIALWHSHGYYFDQPLDRWEWQRAKVFGTVEDISVMGYVLPYLTPMLEKAGATVFLPRERDTQTNEVIVDNDISSSDSEFVLQLAGIEPATVPGFRLTDTLFHGVNPFKEGTAVIVRGGNATYIPSIPEKGLYAVYISYPQRKENSRMVNYSVKHAGGITSFMIDQTVGGGTWIYLGTFLFDKGRDVTLGSVSATADDNGTLALDAVRFGGGMGNVARRPSEGFVSNQWSLNQAPADTLKVIPAVKTEYSWRISGKPRYLEGARYYLQYAGMTDTLVYSQTRYKNDYNDDYMSRGGWVNYLMGSPNGPLGAPDIEGLGLPVDLVLAFHTDAGVTPDTSIIGTLGIYSTAAGGGLFPNGTSRMASRDLTDIIQTQITEDISSIYNIKWSRRGLWDKSYSEARTPNAPAMLLELLSHQNLADQTYGLDPRFRFSVSRAVYKGMLKYLAFNEGRDYVVAPLAVNNFSMTYLGGKRVRLRWEPVSDPLEPTATASRYRLYRRTGDMGFDNGAIIETNSVEIDLEKYNTIYSFKVTAVNEGGESFDSEILAAGFCEGDTGCVMVVNGFDRISGPAWFDRNGMAGVEWWNDRGVADHYDIVATGDQYDFNRSSLWIDDDNPGWGASYSDMEGHTIPGNTFDFTYIHGKALMSAGRSFISSSDEAFCNPSYDDSAIEAVDFIFGEEKTTPAIASMSRTEFSIYTPELIAMIEKLVNAGKGIFISGSYLGSDLTASSDSVAIKFAAKWLHFKYRTGHAVKTGAVYSTDYSYPVFKDKFTFNVGNRGEVYGAEAPDAIEPSGKEAVTAFRYVENNTSAGVMYKGSANIIVLGFPFETIIDENDRNVLMKQISDFFNNK